MMPELSLNILDVAQNSVTAGASLTIIDIVAERTSDRLSIAISDNGHGMTANQVAKVADPFFTTRTTRKVGLGVPFFKMAAELTGGDFSIESKLGVGTTMRASFGLSHIDRMPLGDIASTFVSLVGPNPMIDFVLSYRVDDRSFTADTRQFRAMLGDVPLSEPEVLDFVLGYINENRSDCDDRSPF